MESDKYKVLCGNDMDGDVSGKKAVIDTSMLCMCVLDSGTVSLVFSNGFVLPMNYESKERARRVFEWAMKLIIPNWDGVWGEEVQSGGHK